MITLKYNTDTPLYIQIYEQLKEEMITGILKEGVRLPATRKLAESLVVGRNTVENAYLQLASEGYVESKIGSGFIVQNIHSMVDINSVKNKAKKEKELKETEELKAVKDAEEENYEYNILKEKYTYNFDYGHLNAQNFPLSTWKKLSNKALISMTADDMTKYCERKGDISLRKELKDYLRISRGVSCSEAQIILCSGMEYSLSLLCQLFQDSYHEVALEEPGYIGAREIFKNNRFQVIPIPIEKDGLNIEQLEESTARMVYVTPSHQFPVGAVMPIQKRLHLLEWARKRNGVIIEDDYDSELRYHSRPIPSISSADKYENVIYIGTLSKALSPSMRVSYIVLPKRFLELYNKKFKMYQCPVSLIQQRIIGEFIRSGYLERYLHKACIANKKKHDLLLRTIQEILGDKVIIHGRNAGLHVLVESIKGLSEEEMIERAKNYGVFVFPVSMFWMDINNYSNNMVLLGFGHISEEEIVEGVKQLDLAWA